MFDDVTLNLYILNLPLPDNLLEFKKLLFDLINHLNSWFLLSGSNAIALVKKSLNFL